MSCKYFFVKINIRSFLIQGINFIKISLTIICSYGLFIKVLHKKKPWMASVYTLYRSIGLAKQVIKRLEVGAFNIGLQKVYLQSEPVANFYRKLGYEETEAIKANVSASVF
jgi:N-acetylglutamate synthase-like GNAT family acetyltransferase